MAGPFSSAVLICNQASGSFDAAVEQQLIEALTEEGVAVRQHIALPDGDLPREADLRHWGADLLIIWTGDGTANTATALVGNWDGAILVLPGGTQNLLSKSLHGDRPALDILRSALSPSAKRGPIPMLRHEQRIALITVLVGPATKWAEVRETLRQSGLVSASKEAPEALEAMRSDQGVRVSGEEKVYPALILTPLPDGIDVQGVLADGLWEIAQHGLAWLSGDFRDGPSDFLAHQPALVVEGQNPISAEFDGELEEIPSPAHFRLSRSAVDFLITA